MATRKSRQKPRKTVRRRKSTTMGKILPPIDIKSDRDLKKLPLYIKNGPVIMYIYAVWCGHCQQMMKHWGGATQSPERSIQAVKVNETMLQKVNDLIKKCINKNAKPINPSGFPTIIIVDKKGNIVTNVEPVKDTEVLTNVMNQSGVLYNQAGLNKEELPSSNSSLNATIPTNDKSNIPMNVTIPPNALSMSGNTNVGEESLLGSMIKNSPPPPPSIKSNNKSNNVFTSMDPDSITSLHSMTPSTEENVPVVPPVATSDIQSNTSISNSRSIPLNRKVSGGSLYGALSQTAYTLAPTAILLGTAAYVMKRKSKKAKKSGGANKKHKKTHKKSHCKSRISNLNII
jgi:hypothetical protein